MRLGFTGTREVDDALVDDVKCWVWAVAHSYDEFTTGACVGFDALAARYLLKMRPDATHRLVVPANRSQVDVDLFHEFLTSSAYTIIECMPDGTDYRDRNQRIVEHSDALAACVGYPEEHGKSRRSGSWQTVRLARKALLDPVILTLSELEPTYVDE